MIDVKVLRSKIEEAKTNQSILPVVSLAQLTELLDALEAADELASDVSDGLHRTFLLRTLNKYHAARGNK